ncbi:hypothetical protein RUM44_005015 [Polyplax serrata]|uniref:PDZ domain-containing protein n=1 Tax=Polyplax serrata TaxID=468196 RepID=A0ABR1AWP0_POLSC
MSYIALVSWVRLSVSIGLINKIVRSLVVVKVTRDVELKRNVLLSSKSDDPVTWKLVDSGTETRHMPTFGCDVERILIEIPENTQLGCGICKGPDWRPGIFIQYTKPNSLARRCGLQPGDQILQCNRISFLQIDFSYSRSGSPSYKIKLV